MSRRATQVCRVCRVAVRPDRLLDHLERVHPSMLTEEECEALRALHAERTNSAARQKPEPLVDIVDDDLPDEEEAEEERVDRVRGPSRDFRAGSLEERVDAVLGILSDQCLEPFEGNRKYDQQQRFEGECRRRWSKLADSDPVLVEARERLFDADRLEFTHQYEAGFQERQRALEGPLVTLREAGERGVPHLGIALMTDSWASALAVENLAKMPNGPLRDRALVEALFASGDWAPEAGERAVPGISAETRWADFEDVARTTERAAVELQSVYWTALFETRPASDNPWGPTADLGRAMLLLYDLRHHSALVSGLEFLLDSWVSGAGRVRAVLKDPGVMAAVQTISGRKPPSRESTGS